MIAEYVAEGVQDSPLIRIFGYSDAELMALYKVLKNLSGSGERFFDLGQSSYVSLSGMKSLRLFVGDRSVIENRQGNVEWSNIRQNWLLVSELLDPLLTAGTDAGYHQWLAGREASDPLTDTNIAVVITDSSSGQW